MREIRTREQGPHDGKVCSAMFLGLKRLPKVTVLPRSEIRSACVGGVLLNSARRHLLQTCILERLEQKLGLSCPAAGGVRSFHV